MAHYGALANPIGSLLDEEGQSKTSLYTFARRGETLEFIPGSNARYKDNGCYLNGGFLERLAFLGTFKVEACQ